MLKINATPEEETPEQSDIVGRFRAGYQIDGEPASVSAFRVTTGDAKLAKTIAKVLGVDKTKPNDGGPAEWDASGEDFIEVFTKAESVDIVLESKAAYRSSLVRRTRDGDFMYSTDGEVILAVGEDYEDEYEVGDPDPQAGQDITTRVAKGKKGLGSTPDIRVQFTLRDHPEWGTFEYRTGGWSLVRNSPEGKLSRLADGPIKAVLKLVTVEGKKFTYVKPELLVRGLVDDAEKPEVGETPFETE